MTAEAPKQQKNTRKAEASEDGPTEPLNREERRAQARGKKTGKPAKNPAIGAKKSKVRSQMPGGGVGKFQLPTKNG